jgi:hypothetical protein
VPLSLSMRSGRRRRRVKEQHFFREYLLKNVRRISLQKHFGLHGSEGALLLKGRALLLKGRALLLKGRAGLQRVGGGGDIWNDDETVVQLEIRAFRSPRLESSKGPRLTGQRRMRWEIFGDGDDWCCYWISYAQTLQDEVRMSTPVREHILIHCIK